MTSGVYQFDVTGAILREIAPSPLQGKKRIPARPAESLLDVQKHHTFTHITSGRPEVRPEMAREPIGTIPRAAGAVVEKLD